MTKCIKVLRAKQSMDQSQARKGYSRAEKRRVQNGFQHFKRFQLVPPYLGVLAAELHLVAQQVRAAQVVQRPELRQVVLNGRAGDDHAQRRGQRPHPLRRASSITLATSYDAI